MMDMRDQQELERVLGRLAAEEARLRPVPGDELIARVLADAAEVTAKRRAPASASAPQRKMGGLLSWAALRAEVWLAGATVALAACLMIGFVMGYAVDAPGALLATNPEYDDGMMLADASAAMFGPDAPF